VDNSDINNEDMNADKLNNYINDLKYEVQMFCRLAIILYFAYDDTTNKNELDVIKNAFLESFLVHARIIVNFLSGNDDYTYKFLVKGDPFLESNDPVAELIRKKANPEVMHFGNRDKKTKWNVTYITCYLMKKFKNFLNEAKVDFGIKTEIDVLEKTLCEIDSGEKYYSTSASNGDTYAFNLPYSLQNTILFENTFFDANTLHLITNISKHLNFLNMNLSNIDEFILYPTSESIRIIIEPVKATFMAFFLHNTYQQPLIS